MNGADGGLHLPAPHPLAATAGQHPVPPRPGPRQHRPAPVASWPTPHGRLIVSFPDGSTEPATTSWLRPEATSALTPAWTDPVTGGRPASRAVPAAASHAGAPASAGRPVAAGSAAPAPRPAAEARHRAGWLGGGLAAVGHGLVFGALAAADVAMLAGLVLGLDILLRSGTMLGDVPLLIRVPLGLALVPSCLLIIRGLARLTRRLSGPWCGARIPSPYRLAPAPADGSPPPGWQLIRLAATDPATWRDLLWTIVNPAGAFVLAALPGVLVGGSLIGVILPALHVQASPPLPYFMRTWHFQVSPVTWQPLLLGTALIMLALWAAPPLLTAYGTLARTLLGPTRRAELALRVHHLARTRSDTIDASAAELRRIERDLHDGAQARLVALGMTLDTAEQLLDSSPETARALLAEARQASVRALVELRGLVRGIHPPVLADRGLADAVHALALDCPVRVQVTGELPGRPALPVESAAYFAVSELLANVVKHAGAAEVWIDLRHTGGMLRITVRDDGRGGADPSRGTGLRGIERRLSSFDGVLALASPGGGPTMASMEIPCALAENQNQ